MNRQNNLIPIMARRYRIERGTTEPVEQWQMRVIYSVLGQMAYASLWDKTEDDQPISVVHFKSRMKDLLESYCGIFNGLRKLFGYDYEKLLEEIYNVQLEGGKIYHSAYRLSPASYSAAVVDDVLFARGMAPDEQQFVSGQGTYLLSSSFQESIPLLEMFQLPDQTLTETWRYLVKTAKWNQFRPNDTTEFLRTDPPFKYGYWQREKPVAQEVTLIRMGMNGNRLSSGAGYAVSVADNIEKLLKQIRELLVSCDCGSACHRCLKHYRNQYVHGLLDRFAALELLEWGTSGKLAESLSVEEQHRLLLPLESILRVSGYTLVALDDGILVKRKGGREKKLVVYPAMWKEPQQEDTVYVSDAYIKYAKPYAVQKILNS